ncbi:UvrD-helicase domain-containing protein [Bibersteinia trehalosi]|uniref:UvrD-helicase domain-containing protein n=1 Tax=Bibersteinia trehalosi TaxID=47735 RepID=UPI0040464BE6
MNNIDNDIYMYATSIPPKSFILFAGAGSGKTRTLVTVLNKIRENHKKFLVKNGQKVGVITFTNAACNEIRHRLQYDNTFNVSTIHSFAWELIKPFTEDIKEFISERLNQDIIELSDKILKARTENSRGNHIRERDKKKSRLDSLESCQSFIYSPTETLIGKGTLNHSEVISICAYFLKNKPLAQDVLVSQFPILFVDECQDTQKDLLTALLETQKSKKNVFCLGLFGDLTQQIYSNGYPELINNIPEDWETPSKKNNYRSPKRIVDLINKIGKSYNPNFIEQTAKKSDIGLVRLFILNSNVENKLEKEQLIREKMSSISSDLDWKNIKNVKTLVLEHAMAAKRAGFDDFFLPLSQNDILRDNLLQKTGECFSFLLHQLLPLINYIRYKQDFDVLRILEKYSPLMNNTRVTSDFSSLKELIDKFSTLISNDVLLKSILSYIYETQLLEIPNDIIDGLNFDSKTEHHENDKAYLWNQAINTNLEQLLMYSSYINGELGFDTHQGVKGLEFDHVMAIIDDSEAKGFLFKYDKLFNIEPLSSTDIKNIQENKDNVLTRTSRLFYVICSRAQKELAIVAYTNTPLSLKNDVIQRGWFSEDEIEILE